jgi:hypothetical protein
MKNYRLLMTGHNFLVQVDGQTSKHGFHQTLFVRSETHQQAELMALAQIRHDKELIEASLNAEKDPPVICLETIWELEDFVEADKTASNRVFYPEKKWWQFWK